MKKIIALLKRRGFIFQAGEIYGGISGFWDYGPLGIELKNNIKKLWWKTMVYQREDVVGIDGAIITHPKVWEASGHTAAFVDPLVECRQCHFRFRADKIEGNTCPNCAAKDSFTEPRKFNLLVEALIGTVEPKERVYLRGEITQSVFVNFGNIIQTSRIKIPFGVAQIGKAFRNEITPGNFTYRSREFEQMELEYFIKNDVEEGKRWLNYWKEKRWQWYVSLGLNEKKLRFYEHKINERAHYAKAAFDIEYEAPFGWSELEGIHHRGDWDLSRHKLNYKDLSTGREYTPWVIETSGGVDRALLFFLIDSFYEEKGRIILRLNKNLAPIKIAVFPLLANKEELVKEAKKIYFNLKNNFYQVAWDDRGNIGKRYYSQDEIGTPFCVTVDYQTLKDLTVTVRDRDTTRQERIKISKLLDYFKKQLSLIF